MQRQNLKFKNTDAEKLKEDLETFFNEFEEIEKEMTDRTKMVELAKIEYFHGHMAHASKVLKNALENIDIMDAELTFADYKSKLLQSAQQIGTTIRNENRASKHLSDRPTETVMSSNAHFTEGTSHSATITMSKKDYDDLREQAAKATQWRSREQSDRGRSRSASKERTQSPSRDRSSRSSSPIRKDKRLRTNVTFQADKRSASPHHWRK